MRLEITQSPSEADIAVVRQGLSRYNVLQVPQLLRLSDKAYLVVMRENGTIVAGTVCEFDWGWLYFDTVWTDEAVRGKGYGRLIMNAAESYALKQGIPSAYLMTTSFQARPFYEKLGYETFGELKDHPKGHTFYYMRKTQLTSHEIDSRISIESPPTKDSMDVLDHGILSAIAKTAPFINDKLSVFLRDDENTILGGLVAGIFWDWMNIHLLWIDDSLRGQGWGQRLLAAAANEAQKQASLGIICDTASFQSLPFYQAQGFSIIGTLENRPPKHSSFFIQKRLK